MFNENIALQTVLKRRSGHAVESSSDLVLTLMDPAHEQRGDAEAFVREVFFQSYSARLSVFYPSLLSITYPDGEYAAVAGVRPAGLEDLFSEHYLDTPVEEILGVERENIVEIGNLAPASAGQARWLICTMTAFLAGAGYTHVVFTAVPKLKNAFRRMGLPLTKHADAHQGRLPEVLMANWGTYYQSNPAVFSGDIRVGDQAFRTIAAAAPELYGIYCRAFMLGQAFANDPGRAS